MHGSSLTEGVVGLVAKKQTHIPPKDIKTQ